MNSIIILFAILTLFVLMTGITLMATGGKLNRKYSNFLMRLRVIMQGITLLLVMMLLYNYSVKP